MKKIKESLSRDISMAILFIFFVGICLLMLVRHIPSIRRVFRREEEKLSRIEDISYKFDEKF